MSYKGWCSIKGHFFTVKGDNKKIIEGCISVNIGNAISIGTPFVAKTVTLLL